MPNLKNEKPLSLIRQSERILIRRNEKKNIFFLNFFLKMNDTLPNNIFNKVN